MALFSLVALRARGTLRRHRDRPLGAAPAAADDYAAAFGLAFQVTDDLLDVESTAEKTGKRVGKDATRGKLTYPGLLGVDESRRRAADRGRRAVAAADRPRAVSPRAARTVRGFAQNDRGDTTSLTLLSTLTGPADLHQLTDEQLQQLTGEIRGELIRVLTSRPAHFASNLGVVELSLALHLTFDFSKDRLIWDTGHQVYPHKPLITGRGRPLPHHPDEGRADGLPAPR